MKRVIIILILLGWIATAQAQLVPEPEIAAKLLRCSVLYLAISDIRGEQNKKGRDSMPFLSQGMTYRGMALALTNSEFVSSELEIIGKDIGNRSAADAVALLNDAQPECVELPRAHAQKITEAFGRMKAKEQAGANTK
ncbi:hypothetical protein [Pseudorhodoferax sp. Leaf274]|uniref:hypothetical protein n=1 Tax=Pseudorhodoferax sp. Leaf274 TaxID=1736318 RepID=UPI0012E20DBF|nr:hypothetical protein [Pseudorhodoferax sp. Leaf274]